MEWFMRIVDFLNTPSPARAIALSLIGGMALTQWIKFQFAGNASCRLMIRVTSIIITIALCMMLNPDMGTMAADVATSIIVGLVCPALYWAGIKAVYHFFPWMEGKLSATPKGDAP